MATRVQGLLATRTDDFRGGKVVDNAA